MHSISHPYLAATAQCGVLTNFFGQNLCNFTDLPDVISKIAAAVVGLLGLVLAIVILYAAVEIVTSGGSADRIKTAKNRLIQAAISLGLLISFSAVIGLLGLPTTSGGSGAAGSLFGGINFGTGGNLNSFEGVRIVMVNAMQILLLAVGALSVIFVVVGGIQYIISAGNGSGIENAKKTITYAIAGLILALSVTAIIQFVNQIFF